MDCRGFRKQHLAFVDDTLPGVDVVRMQLHLAECVECERWDQRVRKSLFMARNHLDSIEPSAQFRARLLARLEQEKSTLVTAPPLFGARRPPFWSLALGLGVVGVSMTALYSVSGDIERGALPVAAIESSAALPVHIADSTITHGGATPAFIATVSSGMAILPALMIADELPSLGSTDLMTAVRPVGVTMPAPDSRDP